MTMHEASSRAPLTGRTLTAIAAPVFLQMLPATMLTPAIRPLFAQFHAGNEHAMHAFMAVNMLGAAVVTPLVAARAERMQRPQRLLPPLLLLDALLLALMGTPMPTTLLLLLRMLEGAAHVSATALLLAQAASLARASGTGSVMGVAGAALMFAVALGSGLGAQLVAFDPRMPLWAGAALQLATIVAVFASPSSDSPLVARPRVRLLAFLREHTHLRVPLAAVFVGRFTVGCIVVTFALFAHRHHDASDRDVGILFMLLTLPFAVAVYPLSRLSDRIPRAAMMGVGGLAYAACLAALGFAPFAALPFVMVLAGVSSAALFAPSLCYGATFGGVRKELAMALVNVSGCVGMLIGPMVAGITSAVIGRSDPVAGYRTVFVLASCSVMAWLLASAAWLVRQSRDEAQLERRVEGER